MPLTYAYRLHPTLKGRIQHVPVDLADLPRMLAEGWKDSPEKVVGAVPPPAPSTSVGREPAPSGRVHGEPAPKRRRA